MNELCELLDGVGWHDGVDAEYHRRVFLWMEQATREIDALRSQVERLVEEVQPA